MTCNCLCKIFCNLFKDHEQLVGKPIRKDEKMVFCKCLNPWVGYHKSSNRRLVLQSSRRSSTSNPHSWWRKRIENTCFGICDFSMHHTTYKHFVFHLPIFDPRFKWERTEKEGLANHYIDARCFNRLLQIVIALTTAFRTHRLIGKVQVNKAVFGLIKTCIQIPGFVILYYDRRYCPRVFNRNPVDENSVETSKGRRFLAIIILVGFVCNFLCSFALLARMFMFL